jgi:hypothetical protein
MEREPVLLESLRKHGKHSTSVVLPAENHEHVVGVPDETRAAFEPRLHGMLEPHVHDLVQEDVRKERGDDPSLPGTARTLKEPDLRAACRSQDA